MLTKVPLQAPGGHVDGSPLLLLKFCPQLLSKLFQLPKHAHNMNMEANNDTQN